MNKNFFKMAFVSLFAVVALSSCDENGDENDGKGDGGLSSNVIEVVVENGSAYSAKIDSVKVWTEVRAGDDYLLYTIADVAYNNGKFTLTLPETLDDDVLKDFFVPEGVSVSDLKVKCLPSVEISACQGENFDFGGFYHGADGWEGELIYVDRDVIIVGSSNQYGNVDNYAVNLKKGWNLRYSRETQLEGNKWLFEHTTVAPAGAKWFYRNNK
jgi:hypothetical protein